MTNGEYSIEGVDDLYASLLEVTPIPCGNDETVDECGCGDQTVFDRYRLAPGAQIHQKLRPTQSSSTVPGQTVDSRNSISEPSLEPRAALAAWQQENSKTDLTENDRIDGHFALMLTKPFHDS